MKKTFTTVLPDEPYKTSIKKNTVIECVYDGPQYLLLRVREEDGSIFCIDRESDSMETIDQYKIDQHRLDPEGVYQIVLDAAINTWEAAYLTGYYTHEPFADYEETLPTGEKWTYHYDDEACAVEQPFYINDMYYVKATNTFKRPRYRVHAVAKEDFWTGLSENITSTERQIADANSAYSDEQKEILRTYVARLKVIQSNYRDIDHWKIPFPELRL